ncbi:MAG: trypsin-like peptidase domain-containing protein [Planctomycetes bacterium]|nr:trypsin-like peptidase domain-containing protein [Planctomycetota bacterium]
MQVELIHLNGPFRGKTELRPETRIVLGSSVDAQVRFPATSAVAGQHAVLTYDQGSCSHHLEARGGRVFVNSREISEVILQHRDLIELGTDGPKLRFGIRASHGEVCKPVREMLRDAGRTRHESGLFRATTTFGRDFVFKSSWRVRILVPLVLVTLLFAASFLGSHLAGRSAEKKHRDEEQRRDTELGQLREYVRDLEARQEGLAGRDELDRVRSDIGRQADLVGNMLARDQKLARILDTYSPSVCLIHGIYGFQQKIQGKMQPLEGSQGDPLTVEYTGSGFLASEHGEIITNRHVAEPWWENTEVAPLIAAGFEPVFRVLDVCFPEHDPFAVDPKTIRISADGVDVAVMSIAVPNIPITPLDDADPTTYRGQRIVLLGYPTGVSALLARSERSDVEEIFEKATDLTGIITELSNRRAISPIITQGALNEIKERRLVYDAETTSGGSGGPVFGPEGRVIGVNFAITRNFDGSNFGVPISFAKKLLKP